MALNSNFAKPFGAVAGSSANASADALFKDELSVVLAVSCELGNCVFDCVIGKGAAGNETLGAGLTVTAGVAWFVTGFNGKLADKPAAGKVSSVDVCVSVAACSAARSAAGSATSGNTASTGALVVFSPVLLALVLGCIGLGFAT